MMDSQPILTELIRRQRAAGMADGEFAALLGVARPTWVLVRNGNKLLSPMVAKGAMRAFPDLIPAVVAYLLSDSQTPVLG